MAEVIYAPKGQALEYAPLAANPYRGCGHTCAYCYVPLVTKQPRADFNAGAVPRPGFLEQLRRDARRYQAAGVTDQVLLSFTSDPYHAGDTTLTRQTLEVLIEHGLGFCTLTKGGTRALRDLDLFRPERDAFACTLTSLDNAFSTKWERNAPLPGDRIAALRAFHDAGIFTWVSVEPTIDVDASLAIVETTHEFVDLYKIGRANYLPMTKTTDWRDYTERMIELLRRLGAAHYIKHDLQPFLPAGYHNSLRVPQWRAGAVSHFAPIPNSGAILRQKDKPWLALGISRATWYRHGKPTEKHQRKSHQEIAAEVGLRSKRSLQRYLRVLQSPLAPFLASGWLAAWRADRMLADPAHLQRFLADSTREYLEQVDRFKQHQGKPTERRGTPSMNPGAIRMRQRRAKLRRERGNG